MLNQFYNKVSSLDAKRINYCVIGIILLVATIALATTIAESYSTWRYQPTINTSSGTRAPSTLPDYQGSTITAVNLFGKASASASSTTRATLPTTQMQLVLRGAFMSSNADNASAIIEGPDGQTRSYRVNSRLYGKAVLDSVHADRIVLSRSGQLETLYFPEHSDSSSNDNALNVDEAINRLPANIRGLVKDNVSSEEIRQTASELSSAGMTPEQRQALIKRRLQDLRNRARTK